MRSWEAPAVVGDHEVGCRLLRHTPMSAVTGQLSPLTPINADTPHLTVATGSSRSAIADTPRRKAASCRSVTACQPHDTTPDAMSRTCPRVTGVSGDDTGYHQRHDTDNPPWTSNMTAVWR